MDGVSAMDLPINEYAVGILMRLLNDRSPAVFRVYMLCIALMGLFFLYLIPLRFGFGPLHGLVLVGIFYLSPVYHYYLIGFLPSVAAFSAFLAGTYFLLSARASKSTTYFSLAVVGFTLAALIRLPFVINLAALFAAYSLLRVAVKTAGVRETKWLGSGLALVVLYWGYNQYLTSVHGSMFATQLMPPSSWAEAKYLVKASMMRWGTEYIDWAGYGLLAAMFLLGFTQLKKLKLSPHFIYVILVLVGYAAYSLLMLSQFPDHDYYAIDSFYPPAILLLGSIYASAKPNKLMQWLVPASALVAFLVYSGPRLERIKEFRYFADRADLAYITYKNFNGSEKLMDDLSIEKEAKVLVIDAFTTNIPLIEMNRDGYTVLTTSKKRMVEALEWPFDYVAIQDTFAVSEIVMNYPEVVNRLNRKGGNGRISLYELKKPERASSAICQIFYHGGRNFDNDPVDSAWSGTPPLQNTFIKSGNNGAAMWANAEYGQSLTLSLGQMGVDSLPYKVCVKGYFKMDSVTSKVSSVIVQTRNDSVVHYEQQYFTYKLKGEGGLERVVFNYKIPEGTSSEDELKCYFWKKEAQNFYYDDLGIIVYR